MSKKLNEKMYLYTIKGYQYSNIAANGEKGNVEIRINAKNEEEAIEKAKSIVNRECYCIEYVEESSQIYI